MLLRAFPVVGLVLLCLVLAPASRRLRSESWATDSARPSLRPIPSAEVFDQIARTNPIAMLAACEDRCRAEVRGYRAILTKQERIQGKLYDPESIRVSVRDEPFAVRMIWDRGARSDGMLGFKINAVRYLAGDPEPLVVYRKGALAKETSADPRGADARKAARVGIEDSGLAQAVQRTRAAWESLAHRNELVVEYHGLERHPELGNRECYVWKRICRRPELDPFVRGEGEIPLTERNQVNAFDTVTIWIDRENWLQVGTEQTRDGRLMGRYFFQVLEINPRFEKDEFSKAALQGP